MPNGNDGGSGPLTALLLEARCEPRPLVFGPGKLGIIWSAKSACTTLLLWYLWHCDLLRAARFYDAWPHHFRNHALYSSATYRAWAGEVEPLGWSWLRVIRDPFKRAVSGYRHALRYGYEDASMTRVLKRPIDHNKGYSFDLFLDYLQRINVTTCNLHHRVQLHPIEAMVAPIRIINVDRLNLVEELRRIDATLDTPTEPAATLSAMMLEIEAFHHVRMASPAGDQSARCLSARDTWGEWPAHADLLNESTRAKIATIYAADLERYAGHL